MKDLQTSSIRLYVQASLSHVFNMQERGLVSDDLLQNALLYSRFALHRANLLSDSELSSKIRHAESELSYSYACNSSNDVLLHYIGNARRSLESSLKLL